MPGLNDVKKMWRVLLFLILKTNIFFPRILASSFFKKLTEFVIKSFPKSPNPKNRIKGYQKRIFGTEKKKKTEAVKNEFKKGEKKNCQLTSVQTAVYFAAYYKK
jgi:hypothetical protein